LIELRRNDDDSFELHIDPHGRHGLGPAQENPRVGGWANLACEWLNDMGWQGD
jgi:hypothetical protein